MVAFRVGRRRPAQHLEVHDADSAKKAGKALVAADERIRVAADELGFAEAKLGADATMQACHDDSMPPKSQLNDDATAHYAPYDNVIESWQDLQGAINELGGMYSNEGFVWRGHADARWGLTSSLYRTVADQLGRTPAEDDLVEAERRL